MDTKPADLLSTADAADVLGVSIATVTRMAQSGDLRALMQLPGLRGARIFHRDEVTRVAAERNLAS